MNPPGPVIGPEPRTRLPRDAQRRRVYLAETPLPSSPLPGLDACTRFVDRVVGSLWWHVRFPDRDLDAVPRLRPGQGPRQAFYREEADGPTITLPRRYRTKGVVLHQLAHWALGLESGLPRTVVPSHGCCSTPRASSVVRSAPTSSHPRTATSVCESGSHREPGRTAAFATAGTNDSDSGAGARSSSRTSPRAASRPAPWSVRRVRGGASVVPLHALDGSTTRIATATVWDVTYAGAGEEPTHG